MVQPAGKPRAALLQLRQPRRALRKCTCRGGRRRAVLLHELLITLNSPMACGCGLRLSSMQAHLLSRCQRGRSLLQGRVQLLQHLGLLGKPAAWRTSPQRLNCRLIACSRLRC